MNKGNFIVGTYIVLLSFQLILVLGENVNLAKKEQRIQLQNSLYLYCGTNSFLLCFVYRFTSFVVEKVKKKIANCFYGETGNVNTKLLGV